MMYAWININCTTDFQLISSRKVISLRTRIDGNLFRNLFHHVENNTEHLTNHRKWCYPNGKANSCICCVSISSESIFFFYRGKVCVIVNVASQWGQTNSNYTELEKLNKKYSQSGFCILAFPCNQFARQEPGSDEEIKTFARNKCDVNFELFAKIDVNGENAAPLYKFMKNHKNGKGRLLNGIKWNFSKFLINQDGDVVARYGPNPFSVVPKDMVEQIEKLLNFESRPSL